MSDADRGVQAIVDVLRASAQGRPSRSRLRGGHYAAVLEVAPGLGIAISTDGVGSKLLLAEELGRLDTVGIDCVAMNVNDILCVGAEPIALVDYIAAPSADPAALEQVAIGLARGAHDAGVEIPGGELAVLPEQIHGAVELSGTAIGTVALDRLVTGERCAPGDALVGLPSSGLHSNGYTLARAVAQGRLAEPLAGSTVGAAMLEPTAIYVRGVLELLASGAAVAGLAHITGDGLLNLKRLSDTVGFEIDAPLPVPPICAWLCEQGGIDDALAYATFNMGCGFVVALPAAEAGAAAALLARHHPGTAVIGRVSDRAGRVALPGLGVAL